MLNEYGRILGELKERWEELRAYIRTERRTERRLGKYIRMLESRQSLLYDLEELDVDSEQHKGLVGKIGGLEVELFNLHIEDSSLPLIEPKFYEPAKEGLKLNTEGLVEIVNKLYDISINPTSEAIYEGATLLGYKLTSRGLKLTKRKLSHSVLPSARKKGDIYCVKVGNRLIYYPKDKKPLLEPIEEAIPKIVSESYSRDVEPTTESIIQELTSLGYPGSKRTLQRRIYSAKELGLIDSTLSYVGGIHHTYYPLGKEPLIAKMENKH